MQAFVIVRREAELASAAEWGETLAFMGHEVFLVATEAFEELDCIELPSIVAGSAEDGDAALVVAAKKLPRSANWPAFVVVVPGDEGVPEDFESRADLAAMEAAITAPPGAQCVLWDIGSGAAVGVHSTGAYERGWSGPTIHWAPSDKTARPAEVRAIAEEFVLDQVETQERRSDGDGSMLPAALGSDEKTGGGE